MNNIQKKLLFKSMFFLFVCILSCSENGTVDMPETNSDEEEVVVEDTMETKGEDTEEQQGNEVQEEEAENQLPDDNEDMEDGTPNTIQLSGEETSEVGTSLVVGNIVVGRADLTGTVNSVILSDENTPITDDGPMPEGLEKGFILIGGDSLNTSAAGSAEKDISMVIFIDGNEYRFGCGVPPDGDFINCGKEYNIDFIKREMVFDSTTVNNTETNIVLTLNGTVKWE